jgi:dephospho-CoA kinase
MKREMKRIALTGGMGTGKSTVTWMFQELGTPIINADEIAHQLLKPKTVAWKFLFERYGDRIMQKGGEIDRKALADTIFSDDEERKYVERTIHPRVQEEIVKQVTELEKKNNPYAMIEIPLLFETGWEKDFDTVVVVRCDPEQQIVRSMEKFGLSREDVEARLKVQRPIETKVSKADFVIDNAGSKIETLVQVQRLFKLFEKGEFKPK